MATTTENRIDQVLEDVAAMVAALGEDRKFEPADITEHHVAVAEAYTALYDGDFGFMLDMKADLARWKGLSVGKAKGVLNVARADLRRRQPRAQAPAGDVLGPEAIRFGIFRVVGPGVNVAVRVKPLTADQITRYGLEAGACKFGIYSGGDTDTSYTWLGVLQGNRIARHWHLRIEELPYEARARITALAKQAEPALRILAAGPEAQHAAGYQYSLEAGSCYRCGRTLVVEASICDGIGPRCKRIVD